MLYVKEKSRAIRVPFTRMVLLRSPCELQAENLRTEVSVINSDADYAYRVDGMSDIQTDDKGGVSVKCVTRLSDVLKSVFVRAHSQRPENRED